MIQIFQVSISVIASQQVQINVQGITGEFALQSEVAQEYHVLPDAQVDANTVSLMDDGSAANKGTEILECDDSDGESLITPPNSVLEGEAVQVREDPIDLYTAV